MKMKEGCRPLGVPVSRVLARALADALTDWATLLGFGSQEPSPDTCPL